MKSKGLLFKAPLIKALLNTREGIWPAAPVDPALPFKWQTRRIEGLEMVNGDPDAWELTGFDDNSKAWHWRKKNSPTEGWGCEPPFPIGQHRYVKEGFARVHDALLQHLDPDPDSSEWRIAYRVDGDPITLLDTTLPTPISAFGLKWTSPLFMPKDVARIHLEVVDSRHERLQAITEEDAKAEGVRAPGDWMSTEIRRSYDLIMDGSHYRTGFRLLWDNINGTKKRNMPWSKNPWLWRVVMKRI